MTTIINNPPGDQTRTEGEGGSGFIFGIIFAIIIAAVLFVIYVLPDRQQVNEPDTTINVPDQIRVDVEGSEEGTTN